MADISIGEGTLAGIPLLHIRAVHSEPEAVVIFLHGCGADKRQGLSLAYELAQAGIECYCPDAPMHGARSDPGLRALLASQAQSTVYPKHSGLDIFIKMHEVIAAMNVELAELIPALVDPTRDDAPAIGVTGFSMGAFAAYCAAATYPQIAAAVPIAGIPAFEARWDDVVLEASTYPGWAEAMRRAGEIERIHADFIRKLDPSNDLSRFAPKPLLIIHGDRDLDSPKKYSVDLLRSLRPSYADYPDNLRMNIHDEASHELNRSMIRETADWFRSHLIP